MVKYVLKSASPAKPSFDLGEGLNPQQRAVVEAPPGKILVLAGAGTGKTRTLTTRVARLIAGGCPPERVMLVTFTNRAAREMVRRVEGIIGADLRRFTHRPLHVRQRLVSNGGIGIGVSDLPMGRIDDPFDR